MFSIRLKSLRQSKNLSQQELATRLNLTRGQLSMYEIGKREPDLDTLKKIADFFNVSIDDLVSDTSFNPHENPLKNDYSMDEKMKEIMSDPYAMAMFSDFPSASEEDKKMWLEIWNSIKNRGKDKE